MKKAAIAICLTLFSVFTYAQEGTRPNGWSYGLVGSPDFTSFLLRSNHHESLGFSFSGGLTGSYQVNKRLAFSVSLEFSQYESIYKDLLPDYTMSNNIVSIQGKGDLGSLYIPLKMDYYLSQGKTALYLTGGVAIQYACYYLYQTETTYGDGHSSTARQAYTNLGWFSSRIGPQMLLGMGLDCPLKKFRLRVEPNLRLGIPAIYNFDSFDAISFTAALNLTWFFHTKK